MAGRVDSDRHTVLLGENRIGAVAAIKMPSSPLQPPPPIGRVHRVTSQGETEQGTSRLAQNTPWVPPTPCSRGGENTFLKGQPRKMLNKWIPQHPDMDTCLYILIP